MNNNLQSFEVNGNDPYFTADKWNETLNYSKCFEKMINGILGNKFKGIYKPFEKYNLYDYVWFNDDYYQIVSEKTREVEVIEKQNYDNLYYDNSNYYIGLNPDKKIVNIIGQTENEVSNIQFDKFYLFNNEIVALKGQNLYKVNLLTKSSNPINYIFSRQIKDIKRDKFQIYILSDRCVEVGNTINDDLTETNVLYNSDENISDIAINDTEMIVLKVNNKVDIVNKSSGNLVSSFEITQPIEHSKTKILSPDNYSLVVYDGEKLLMFFNNNGQYIYSGYASNDYLKYGVNTLTERNGYICATNNAGATVYLANRYNLEKADIFSLLINHSKVDKMGVEEYLDFSKGQFETEKLKPQYTRLSVINDKGVNINNPISYDLQNLLNKTIQLNIECQKPINGKICSINIGNKLCDFNINTSSGKHIYFIDFENSSYRVTSFNGDVKTVESFNYSTGSNQNKITFSSNVGYILNSFTIFDSIIPFHRKDYFNQNSIQSFDIQASTKSYPFSYVKTDENGNININIPDNSIIKNNNGYKVNFSEEHNRTDSDIGLSLKGAKNLWDKVVMEISDINNNAVSKTHKHTWSDILRVPDATTNNKGIVQLSNSINGSSETMAASEKTISLLWNKVTSELNRLGSSLANKLHRHNWQDLDNVPSANVNTKGIVRLSNSIDGSSEEMAASEKSLGLLWNKVYKELEGISSNTVSKTHKHSWIDIINVPSASTDEKGIVRLSNSINGTSETMAASEKAVKLVKDEVDKAHNRADEAYNKGNDAYNKANHEHPYLSNSGGTVNGNIVVNGTSNLKGNIIVPQSNDHFSEGFGIAFRDNGNNLKFTKDYNNFKNELDIASKSSFNDISRLDINGTGEFQISGGQPKTIMLDEKAKKYKVLMIQAGGSTMDIHFLILLPNQLIKARDHDRNGGGELNITWNGKTQIIVSHYNHRDGKTGQVSGVWGLI